MPRPRTRASCAAAVAIALCATLTGCGGGASATADGKVTLRFTWWGNTDRAARTEKAVAAFERAHPGIDVQTSYSTYDSYKQKLATQAAGDDVPDLIQLDYRQISQYAGSGVMLDLAEQRKALPTGEMDPKLLKTGQVGGRQYALPMGVGTQTVAYDKAAWRAAGVIQPQAGWSWQDWVKALRQVKEHRGTYAMTDPGAAEDQFEIWLRGRGKQLYGKDGQVAFSAGDLARWWTFTSKLRKEGLVSPATDTTQMSGSVEDTPMGRKLSVAEFNWDAPSAGYEAMYGDRLAIAPTPTGEDGTFGQYYKPSMLLGISAGSEHPREAAQFIDFLLNSDKAADILGVDRGTPVNSRQRSRVLSSVTGFQKQVARLQTSLRGKLDPPPAAPPRGDNGLQSTFQRDYDQVSFEKLTPREAAENFLTEARAELRP
ncbi:sugar ABC transporter substrate-binding protein [Streptomyces abyssalis]|uniref:Sugar ABC transporter substrate-binding protein n=1 Tax=Streptomyces abyssalis TaxID=933944 RepID=A0A1E7JJI9_9ACTN|nr:ABC transporter substrate-binding protein [Streptomyces abyssalis]OEU87284.1 sugar ABC transporter substrate-binding protein [Streptomyces abyssalis]OEU87816.1 sugar ABC transporter substrate-binding protein [Streptomyces abyssalis]OEV08130.1 sugar ABC transporter substrate-binding protein [Streptomyces nanshensis]